ncbi:hypothetical protein FA13DRAFT_942997 [Coprinellus micaceus]|uniref:Chitin synthase export chaperone n=1 Tax=Coprinellus micaceus TaxID=71717 RepID=A0A4Y7RZA3_COPMI|nr:hypothetical protein FA13DRAFT_942997 [Coprinellus micaceus]
MWGRDWRTIKVLYLLSRYIPFAYLPAALIVGLQASPTISKCSAAFATSSLLIVTGMMVAEAVMFIRVHALSGHSKALAIWLGLQFVAVHAAIYAIFAMFVKSTKFLPYQIGIPGCIPYRFDTGQLSVVFGIIVASETIIMLITAYFGVRRYRMSDSPLLAVFYQDGVLYFVSLAAATVGNIIFGLAGPPELRFMLAVPQGVLHSVLSCRLILHMYDFARKEVMVTQETGTALEFATVDAGNRDANRSTDPEAFKKSTDEETA